jgi:tetratricopeptide (TPR) repeat protein/TolB-like protein
MTPERWAQIDELYHQALELDADAQAEFLTKACAGDARLREEMESLIESHDQAEGFISEPALKVAARALAEHRTTSFVGRTLSHYRIESLLGVGGMGEVYLAEDTTLDRKVAVKLLNDKFSQNESNLTRFTEEAKAASALNHPNILVIHEIGASQGSHYIVSELIEGKTLRELISEGPLQLSEVLEISIQIGNALCSAHEARLVHRDIKPENIMIRPDGYVKVLDFGLAKLIEQTNDSILASDRVGRNRTADNMILGTVNYMSPEQAKGQPVDQRSDIFSVGVMLYEMIAGGTPFAGDSTSETLAHLITAEPQPLSNHSTNLPDGLQAIVSRTLRKDREERYQTMKELVTDLKDLSIASPHSGPILKSQKALAAFVAVALIAGAIGLGYHFFSQKPSARADGKTSFAVLPLKPINTADRDQLYELGIADSLILKLGSLGFQVRPLSATRQYTDLDQDPVAAGKEQDVDFVLASNYQLARGKVRVTAQLFNVGTGQIEQTYTSEEKDPANVFAMQDAIAREVGNVLSAHFVTTPNERSGRRGTTNEEAYRLYLQAMYLIDKRSPAEAQKAVQLLEQAVHLDPNYAQAWAGKARVHLGDFAGNPQTQYQKSMEGINKALAVDPNLADAHSLLCLNKNSYEWDFDGAQRECERAIELDSNSSLAHLNYSRYLSARGRSDAAIAEAKTSIDLEPTSLANQRQYGIALYYARRYPEAVTQFKRVVAMDSGVGGPYNWLISSLEMQGHYAEAFESLMKMKALHKDQDEVRQALQTAYQNSGWPGVLRERARRHDAVGFRSARAGVYFQGAIEQAKVGNKEEAFKYLEQSYQTREFWMIYLKADQGLDSLHDDPRFDQLIQRVALGKLETRAD